MSLSSFLSSPSVTVELLGRQADRKSSEKQEVEPLPGVHSQTLPKPTITSMLMMPTILFYSNTVSLIHVHRN